jgi:hypothetical protein
LDLFSQPVTDKGLQIIEGLPALRDLDIRGTQVTDDGVRRLKMALPQLKVLR